MELVHSSIGGTALVGRRACEDRLHRRQGIAETTSAPFYYFRQICWRGALLVLGFKQCIYSFFAVLGDVIRSAGKASKNRTEGSQVDDRIIFVQYF